MHRDTELIAVSVVVVALVLAAVVRGISKRTGFPFTVAMLLVGGALGWTLGHWGHSAHGVAEVLGRGAGISPHLIIFVFLPALVFESAFAIDTHAVRKNLSGIVVLAAPALLVATLLTALAMVWITGASWHWSLSAALVFGALISATDPVAVVAILREVGAPKRLGVLIEGESLFNDGTAIVVFSVLLAALQGGATEIGAASSALAFAKVAGGGIAVGLVFGLAATTWVSRTFDDPMVEISLTLILAYAAMIVAEGVLHVSGVLAVVTAGMFMSGPGRYRISPEVRGFLHEFWELLAYLANALIFFLVGAIISTQLGEMGWQTLVVTLGAFAAIVVVRFGVVFGSLPLINRLGPPVTSPQATVMAWGGLRGAVSLALALAVSQDDRVDRLLGDQILQVTAGVVLLTIVCNGMTTGLVLRWLGFDQVAPAERLAALKTTRDVLDDVRQRVERATREPELFGLRWNAVLENLENRQAKADQAWEGARQGFDSSPELERELGLWRRALAAERQSYREAFYEGLLSATARDLLRHEVDLHQDALDRGDPMPPRLRAPKGKLHALVERLRRRAGAEFGTLEFERVSVFYDVWRATARGATAVQLAVGKLSEADPQVIERILETYTRYERDAKERLEDLRVNLPEVASAIEGRLAHRVSLNIERSTYQAAISHGELDENAAEEALGDVRRRMKRLHFERAEIRISETADLCRQTPLFAALPEEVVDELARMTVEQVFARGEYLFHTGDRGDAMYVIARGIVHVLDDTNGAEAEPVAVLGGGDLLGEMALVTGDPRTATARAASTVTLGRISKADFDQLMSERPRVRERILAAAEARAEANWLRRHSRTNGELTP
ncbi:MAG: cation:proton antiporter [Polyangiaceae bacterium]|nr:cation:proton antiporter [Myxococcales bacterium]MCB9590757.1 cation:proton antiporter [Polyangiaceae bacterium]